MSLGDTCPTGSRTYKLDQWWMLSSPPNLSAWYLEPDTLIMGCSALPNPQPLSAAHVPAACWDGKPGCYLRGCRRSHCPCWPSLEQVEKRPWGSAGAVPGSLWQWEARISAVGSRMSWLGDWEMRMLSGWRKKESWQGVQEGHLCECVWPRVQQDNARKHPNPTAAMPKPSAVRYAHRGLSLDPGPWSTGLWLRHHKNSSHSVLMHQAELHTLHSSPANWGSWKQTGKGEPLLDRHPAVVLPAPRAGLQ